MNFAHLSDTHVLCRRSQTNQLLELVDDGKKLAQAITAALNHPQKPELMIITGDLVHEGTAEDYAYFKSILEDNCKGIPYVVCLGNHDRRQAFWEGFLEKTGVAKPYVETTMINGLRIIALDTSPVDGNEIGEMPQEQLDYLAKELKTAAPKGTIVILHHPPQGFVLKGFEGLCPVRDAFANIVEGTDVKAVLSGHTHYLSCHSKNGVTYATAASTAFSMDNAKKGDLDFIDACSYNLGRITEDSVYVGTETVNYQYKTLLTMKAADMEKMLKNQK
jgi:Icc protein